MKFVNATQVSDLSSLVVWPSDAALGRPVVQGHKEPLYAALPLRMRRLRKAASLTPNALGVLVGWTSAPIVKIEEAARIPAVDTVERLAAALGVSPGWLAYGDEGTETFQQRRPRSPVPMDPPVPEPGQRESAGLYREMGARCKRAREHRGLSLRALARQAGISAQSLLLTEAGETVPLVSTCEALAGALFVSPVWLAYGYGVGVEEG